VSNEVEVECGEPVEMEDLVVGIHIYLLGTHSSGERAARKVTISSSGGMQDQPRRAITNTSVQTMLTAAAYAVQYGGQEV